MFFEKNKWAYGKDGSNISETVCSVPAIIYNSLNKYKGIDITDLEDTTSNYNVFNISSKIHQWLPNQYGKISLSLKDYLLNLHNYKIELLLIIL